MKIAMNLLALLAAAAEDTFTTTITAVISSSSDATVVQVAGDDPAVVLNLAVPKADVPTPSVGGKLTFKADGEMLTYEAPAKSTAAPVNAAQNSQGKSSTMHPRNY